MGLLFYFAGGLIGFKLQVASCKLWCKPFILNFEF